MLLCVIFICSTGYKRFSLTVIQNFYEIKRVMTISLSKNPVSLFPPDVLGSILKEKPWRVAHTKSRREKALAQFLMKKNIGYYLPMLKKRQPNKNRINYSLTPLFSGYLFFKGSLEDRYSTYTSNHIARVIEVKNQLKLIEELRGIRKVLSSGVLVYPYDFLAEGQRVRIRSGPMQGVEGIIDRKKGNYRLVLKVETIVQAIALDLDVEMVEAA